MGESELQERGKIKRVFAESVRILLLSAPTASVIAVIIVVVVEDIMITIIMNGVSYIHVRVNFGFC